MQGYAASSEIQMQALRKELDAANKKNDRYAHLVAMLTEELGDLRRSICHNCKKKFVPSYAPVPSSSDGPRPSLWRRIISGHQIYSPSSALPPVSTISTTNVEVSPNASNPMHPVTASRNHETTAMSAPPLASSSAIDEIQSKQVVWNVSHNPEIMQALHIDLVKTFDFPSMVSSVQFSPDGKYLAVGLYRKSGKTYIYDVETGLKICFLVDLYLQEPPTVRCVRFSPDNKYIATASSDARVRVWEIARKRLRAAFTDHRVSANSLCFSPNGRSIVSGDELGGVRIWSLRDGSSRKLLDDVPSIFVTFSPDGRHIASADIDGWLRIWDTRTGQLLDTWKGHTYPTCCVAFTPDATGLVSGGGDNTLRYWDVSSLAVMKPGQVIAGTLGQRFQQIRVFEGHSAIIRSVSFSHDRRWVVTSSGDLDTFRIWDPHTARWQCTLHGDNGSVVAVGFSSAGTYLASGGRQVRLWRYREV